MALFVVEKSFISLALNHPFFMKYLLACCWALFFLPLQAQQAPKKIKLPKALEEASGLYIESPDKLWWHNDSGGKPRLLATDSEGNIVDSIYLNGIQNRDWEDISVDDEGNLYIGDVGNNRNNRKDLTIFILNRATGNLDSISYHYPEQKSFPPAQENWNFNMEGFFWANDSLYLFTKNRIGRGTDVTRQYVLPDQPGRYAATLVDSLQLDDRVVTAAAMSPDGTKAALVAYTFRVKPIPRSQATLYIFTDFPAGRYLQGTMTSYPLRSWPWLTQYEAVDFWDNDTVIVGSEAAGLRAARAIKVMVGEVRK